MHELTNKQRTQGCDTAIALSVFPVTEHITTVSRFIAQKIKLTISRLNQDSRTSASYE
jgi:hypothetical protein